MAFYDTLLNNMPFPVMIAVASIVLILFFYLQKYHDVPPGPWGIPLLGYWPFFRLDSMHLQLQNLGERYGDVCSVSITGRLHIFLNSMKILKEAYLSKGECFGEKPSDFSILTYAFEGGVGMANGELWNVQRKFFHQKFKEYGMLAAKEKFSSSMYDVANEIVDEISAMKGESLEIGDLLISKCSCILRKMLFNDQGIMEEELKELNSEYNAVMAAMMPKNMLLIGNVGKYLVLPFIPSYRGMHRSHNRILAILTDIINRHKAAFDKTQELDIIDGFYKEKHERELKGDPTAVHFTDQALVASVYQFLADGVLSVAFFIVLFIQSLIDHPEEQEKVYHELSEVVGPGRQPTIEDKSKLPYTNAFIQETLRCYHFFPSFPSLQCTKETTLNGYRIPKGAITVLNITAMHHDPCTYKDPFTFNPSRFIPTPGKEREDLPIMFGIGKRACLGEPFTMIQVFLLMATLVKNFYLSGETVGFESILEGEKIKICAHSRNQEARSVQN